MKNDKDFSFISVNSDDDEEIVIQAGVVGTPVVDDTDVPESPGVEGFEANSSRTEIKDEFREMTEEDLDEKGPFNKMRLIILGVTLGILVIFLLYFLL